MKEDWMDYAFKMDSDEVIKWLGIVANEDGYKVPKNKRIEITDILEKYPIMKTVCYLMFQAGDISEYY